MTQLPFLWIWYAETNDGIRFGMCRHRGSPLAYQEIKEQLKADGLTVELRREAIAS